MEKQPSLESKNQRKRRPQASPSPLAVLLASASVHCSAQSSKPSRTGGNLVLVPTRPTPLPSATSASDNDEYEIFEEDEYDLNDAMSESEPSNDVSIECQAQDVQHDVCNGSPKPTRRGKRKKGIPLSPKAKVGKKGRIKHSDCWKHFKVVKAMSKTEPGKTIEKDKCNYCKSLFAYSQGGQTSSLNRHLLKCSPFLNSAGRQLAQGTLGYDPDKSLAVVPTEYDHDETRRLIAKMIIVHEYPFKMVEHVWFNVLMRYMNPSYKFIGWKTIRSECIKVYESEKELLRKSLKAIESISLTCDLWTSNQNICYMALVAHYIDPCWVMQCRVLNFIELDPPHTGNVIAQAVFECISEWKIEDKIISITLDNASSNDVAVRNLMAKFIARRIEGFIPKYFHVRCCAHIVNLVVNDGLEPLQPLIMKLRETVKYLKKSPSRMYKFLEVCKSMNLTIGPGLCLDVSTRWSSTYRMFDVCIPYRAAFTEYGDSDMNYKWEPSHQDWRLYSKMQPILKAFAMVTTVLSGSLYPTANIFYPYIVNVKIALVAACNSGDEHMNKMAKAMLEKFDKYWEDKNNVMVIATILDPRFKMRYIQYYFKMIFGEIKSLSEENDVRLELYELYDTFESEYRCNKASDSRVVSSSSMQTNSSIATVSSGFQSFLRETSIEPSKSELLIYLDEANHPLEDTQFVLLDWWRLNAHRFPVVSKMAMKFLTIPATSVSSESTFSTSGRVLDDYRSALRPAMVEALVCASSFIRGSKIDKKPPIIVEEDVEDDVELVPFPEYMVESC